MIQLRKKSSWPHYTEINLIGRETFSCLESGAQSRLAIIASKARSLRNAATPVRDDVFQGLFQTRPFPPCFDNQGKAEGKRGLDFEAVGKALARRSGCTSWCFIQRNAWQDKAILGDFIRKRVCWLEKRLFKRSIWCYLVRKGCCPFLYVPLMSLLECRSHSVALCG